MRVLARLATFLRAAMLCAAVALGVSAGAPSAWGQPSDASQSGVSTSASADPLDNSTEYALDPTYREPSAVTRLAAGAAVVAGAFVVGVVAAGTATGGLVAAGAMAWLYATIQ